MKTLGPFWVACYKLGVIIILALVILCAAEEYAEGQPVPSFTFSQYPYCHNLQYTLTDPAIATYSGRHVVRIQEWGAFAFGVDPGGKFQMNSPVATEVHQGSCPSGTNYQVPAHLIKGDCYGSASALAASPGAEKWVVLIGINPMCKEVGTDPPRPPDPVQVLRLDGPAGLRYIGQVADPTIQAVAVRDIRLIGDTAYIKQTRFSTTYSIIDLNTLTVTGSTTAPPAYTPQADIEGYTYTIAGVIPSPQPVPFCGPCSFVATRHGGVPPTPSVIPPTITPTPQSCTPREVTRLVVVTATPVPKTATRISTPTRTATKCSSCSPTPTPHFSQRTPTP